METNRQVLDFDADVANFRMDKNRKQVRALELLDSGLIKFLLYGGALGGGKSYFLRWYLVRRMIKLFERYKIRDLPVMLACEDYPALKDRQLVKIVKEFPSWLGRHVDNHKVYGNCFLLEPEYGSGAFCFRNLDDPSKYMSSEWAAIGVDELTKNKYGTFTDLRMRLRYPGIPDIECQFVGGTNPGGIGHGWVKQMWMTKQFPPEWYDGPIDYRTQFVYVPSLADDNPYLDPGYWRMLETLSAPLRKAFRYGDWSTFIGQAFPELSKVTHEYKPAADLFPEGAWIGMTFDWGFGKPFSLGWWHTDADGRLYRAAEWYGWNGTADEGLRLPDSQIAEGIKKREAKWGISNRVAMRKAGPDCFQKKPDYKGGGQGKSTAEIFRDLGIVLTPGDPSRALKIRQFRERLRVQDGDKFPMMLINADCENFWRTVPDLIVDENNIEDVETKSEDHIYDEIGHVVLARPLSSVKPVIVVHRPPKDASEVADLERQRIWEEVNQANEQNIEPF